ncbi:gyrA [Acrasis kona]|uniref:GyrA n=1 Tax=Acrasis kona TaxID=1008807 RepID=A0AAW2ZH62_9EUKA
MSKVSSLRSIFEQQSQSTYKQHTRYHSTPHATFDPSDEQTTLISLNPPSTRSLESQEAGQISSNAQIEVNSTLRLPLARRIKSSEVYQIQSNKELHDLNERTQQQTLDGCLSLLRVTESERDQLKIENQTLRTASEQLRAHIVSNEDLLAKAREEVLELKAEIDRRMAIEEEKNDLIIEHQKLINLLQNGIQQLCISTSPIEPVHVTFPIRDFELEKQDDDFHEDSIVQNNDHDEEIKFPLKPRQISGTDWQDSDAAPTKGLGDDDSWNLSEDEPVVRPTLINIESPIHEALVEDEEEPSLLVDYTVEDVENIVKDENRLAETFLCSSDEDWNNFYNKIKSLFSANQLTPDAELSDFKVRRGHGVVVRFVIFEQCQEWCRSPWYNPCIFDFQSSSTTLSDLRCGLCIGQYLLTWDSTLCICVPKRIVSLKAQQYIQDMLCLGEIFQKNLININCSLSKTVSEWNKKREMNVSGFKFVKSVLNVLNLKKPISRSRLGDVMYNFIENMSVDGVCRMSHNGVVFVSHEELDEHVRELITNNNNFSITNYKEFSLLRMFDRIFWSKLQNNTKRKEFEPKTLGNRSVCPFVVHQDKSFEDTAFIE